MWTKRATTLLIILLTLVACCSSYHAYRTQQQLITAQDIKAKLQLELEGFKKGDVKSDISTTTPTLTDSIKRVTREGATPVVTAHTVYERVEIPVPGACPPPVEGVVPTTPTLMLAADHDFALALTPKGAPYHLSRLFIDYGIGSSTGRVELPPDQLNTRISFSADVQNAFTYWADRPPRFSIAPRHIRHWRTGLVAGVGITTDANATPSIGLFAGYGIQF